MFVSLPPSAGAATMGDMLRRIVHVVFDGFQLLDLAGPADVFATAGLLARPGGYRVEVAAGRAGPVAANTGIRVEATTALADVGGEIDTLIVSGGLSVRRHLGDPELAAQLRRISGLARRTASVCNGALLLAEAGLLAGRRATTHWLAAGELARRYPDVTVDADRIHQRDGDVWTSAGVTAGIDLALALVADDHGARLAHDVARGLVVYLHRPGGQSQFSAAMTAPASPDGTMRELQAYIDGNPGADLSVPALARRTGLSERHFARVFTERVGTPPGRYVERSRAEAARRLLETTDHPLDRIARETGIGAPETLFRVFRRLWRVAPGEYRRRFTMS
ncbi:AraC family transcriptional regulator [Actinoplanes philippinensis]|uniref:Transcriptional regulator GlxA family, contains an amidase domain and an AraC-type DNA-binding HTH domain n=2 Tax=Actinoplanes philippinensis TaxID=35752 RepID=A0A1I2E2Q6_9ACTN|nr:AraC family transcriptional regulator [Actinoplanes philippinensis]SFE86913.1 Transcriptional regulator GlxA family, contains an amidase domain and an AraC-type DNA-binding HTH domain [Actinoplanes philippinensis]